MQVERNLISTLATVASDDPPRNRTARDRVLKLGEGVEDDFIEFLLLPAPASVRGSVAAASQWRAGPVDGGFLSVGVPGGPWLGLPGAVRGSWRSAVH